MSDLPGPQVVDSNIRDVILENEDLVVKKTTLPKCNFLGLFAKRKFSKGETVCVYHGTVLRTAEALRLEDKAYLMRLGEQCYVDSKFTMHCLARYINDCRNPKRWNVQFDKRPSELCALVIATREIQPGEEVFVDYGRWYWIKNWSVWLPDEIVGSDLSL
eukprot:scaffold521_cov177-Ochromonas_danica.AAC.18